MDDADRTDSTDDLLRLAARTLTGLRRRAFQAQVTRTLCGGSPRVAERRFGWGRGTVDAGLHERDTGIRRVERFADRGKVPIEVARPQLAADIRDLVEPRTQARPELKSDRVYSNPSAREVCELLRTAKGYAADAVSGERTMRDILNRMGYRLERIRKAKPLRKTASTDDLFANVAAVKAASRTTRRRWKSPWIRRRR